MEHKNVEVVTSGLKCDNPSCDWQDETITFESMEGWVNAPCPKCGENVLTEEDYERAKMVNMVVSVINVLSPEELEELGEMMQVDAENNPVFAEGGPLHGLTPDDIVELHVDTHNEIKITATKKPDQEI